MNGPTSGKLDTPLAHRLRILNKTQTIDMKELISRSVVLIFCLSFLIFGTRESQAIAANFGIRRQSGKRAMNRNQVIFYLLSSLFESMCQPSERNLENVHFAAHFVFKVKHSSFLNPRFGLREVWTLIFFPFYFFSSYYPSTELTWSWFPWAIIAVKRQAIQATLTETKGRRLFCSVSIYVSYFLSLTLLLL